MPIPDLAGYVYDSVGSAVDGAVVKVFDDNGVATSSIGGDTTDANGFWSLSSANGVNALSSASWPNITITVGGTEVTRFRYDDKIALTKVDAQEYVVRNAPATSSFGATIVPDTFTADRTFTLPDQDGRFAVTSGSTNEITFGSSKLTANRTFEAPDTTGSLVINTGSTYMVVLESSNLTAKRAIRMPDQAGQMVIMSGAGYDLTLNNSNWTAARTYTLANDSGQVMLGTVSSYTMKVDQSGLTANRTFVAPELGSTVGTFMMHDQSLASRGQFAAAPQATINMTSSQVVNSSTLAPDTYLQFSLASAATYKADIFLWGSAPAGGSGSVIMAWTVSSGTTIAGVGITTTTENSSVGRGSFGFNEAGSNAIFSGSTNAVRLSMEITTGGSAGLVYPNWRQGAADATVSVIYGGWATIQRTST